MKRYLAWLLVLPLLATPAGSSDEANVQQTSEMMVFASLGRVAYDAGKVKELPPGMHDFVPHPAKGSELNFTDAICYRWEKVLSVQARLQVLVEEEEELPKGKKSSLSKLTRSAVGWVNDRNKKPEDKCAWGEYQLVVNEYAIRGYEDEEKVLHEVEILSLKRPDGLIVYSGRPR